MTHRLKRRKLPDTARERSETAPRGAVLSLQALKTITQQTSARRVEGVVSHIRTIAKSYIDTGSTQVTSPYDTEDELRRLLFRLNPLTRLIACGREQIRLAAPHIPQLARLPMRYGLKGGGARLALAAALGKNVSKLAPRDIDLVRFGSATNAIERFRDRTISMQFMGSDFAHGHGVEVVPTIETYLSTRDLTINEVVLVGGYLVCSHHALRDMLTMSVRATDFVKLRDNRIPGRTAAKMLRIAAESRIRGEDVQLIDFPSGASPSAFDIALHLDRALEISESTAAAYVRNCQQFGFLPDLRPTEASDPALIAAAIKVLSQELPRGTDLRFQGASASVPPPKPRHLVKPTR